MHAAEDARRVHRGPSAWHGGDNKRFNNPKPPMMNARAADNHTINPLLLRTRTYKHLLMMVLARTVHAYCLNEGTSGD